MKNDFYFMLKALFVLEIFTFLFRFFGYVKKRLDKKAMVGFKIYDVTEQTANNYNTHTVQYLCEIWSLNRINHTQNMVEKPFPDPFVFTACSSGSLPKCILCYILLTDQISLPDCIFFLRYWVIRVLLLFVVQSATS